MDEISFLHNSEGIGCRVVGSACSQVIPHIDDTGMEGQARDRLGLTGRGWWICRIGHLDFFTAIQAHLVQVRDRSAQQSFRGLVAAAQDNAAVGD